jgi:hypothetical protein
VQAALSRHEGILDRIRPVQWIAPAGFDPAPYIGAGNGPVVDPGGGHGAVTVHGDIAVLDRTDPTDPYLLHVETDGSLTEYQHPDVFNDPTRGPGNFYRLVLSLSGDPDDGMVVMWLSDDVTLHQRANGAETVTTPGGRWLTYAAGTPL